MHVHTQTHTHTHIQGLPDEASLQFIKPVYCSVILNSRLPGGSVVKNAPANSGDSGLIPGSGRFPGEGNGNPLQCSYLGNPMDRRAPRATVHGIAKKSKLI